MDSYPENNVSYSSHFFVYPTYGLQVYISLKMYLPCKQVQIRLRSVNFVPRSTLIQHSQVKKRSGGLLFCFGYLRSTFCAIFTNRHTHSVTRHFWMLCPTGFLPHIVSKVSITLLQHFIYVLPKALRRLRCPRHGFQQLTALSTQIASMLKSSKALLSAPVLCL